MLFFCLNHRAENFADHLVFFAGPETPSPQSNQAEGKEIKEKVKEKELPKNTLTLEEKINEGRRYLYDHYGEAAIEKMIKGEIEKFSLIDDKNKEYLPEGWELIVESGKKRWTHKNGPLQTEMATYNNEAVKIKKKCEIDTSKARLKCRNDLNNLKASVASNLVKEMQKVGDLAQSKAKENKEAYVVKDALTSLFSEPGEDEIKFPPTRGESLKKFHNYIDEIGDRHFDAKWIPEKKKVRYFQVASRFQYHMHDKVDKRMAFYYANGLPELKDLREFQAEIENEYRQYAEKDGDAASISLEDFELAEKNMENLKKQAIEKISALSSMTDKEAMDILEEAYKNPDQSVWIETIDRLYYQHFSDQAIKDGNEAKVIALADKMKKENGEGEDRFINYAQAEYYLYVQVRKKAELGVKPVMDLLAEMSRQVTGRMNDLYKGIPPEALVAYTKIISGEVMPEAKRDRIMVEFVTAPRKEKERILENSSQREQLFLAIRTAETKYGSIYNKRYSKNPEDGAELKALELIAKEARWLVENYNHHRQLGSRELLVSLNRTEAAEGKIHVGRLMARRVRRRYRSALSRGGFNARDLAVSGIKVAAGITVLVNIANSIAQADQGDFLDKTIQAAELVVTNPTTWLSMGVAYGANVLQKNPQYFNHFKYGEYGQRGNTVAHALNNMVDSIGYPATRGLINDRTEWRAMRDLHPSQVRLLVDKANKRGTGVALIRKKDLEEMGVKDEILNVMMDDPRRSQARLMFYEKTLLREVKDRHDINELKEMITGNAVI